jgi:DNA-binding NarL/FixJ family response regulator
MNILILDDHPIILNSLEESLKSIVPNANVLCTTNIDDANKIISNNQINYAICDVQIVTGKSTLIPSICFKKKSHT